MDLQEMVMTNESMDWFQMAIDWYYRWALIHIIMQQKRINPKSINREAPLK
jgi:hypothetical protein